METLQRLQNRGSVSTGYDVNNSLKLEHDNDEQLERASSNGNRRTWTHSCWFKIIDPSSDYAFVLQHFGVNNQATRINIDPGENFKLSIDLCDTGTTVYRTITNRQFRDPSAWYHLVVAVDTTQATDSNRLKVYVNGVQETSFSQTQYPTQNLDTLANVSGYGNEAIATYPWAGATYDGLFSGYIAEHILVDGQQLTPTSFGKFDTNGVWIPIDPSSITFGTNGHYLKFDDSSSLGADSGNSNDYTTYNIAAADQATDTPTNNFCTLNPIVNFKYTTNGITEGGTVFGDDTGGGIGGAFGTMAVTAGKWYWEVKLTQQNSHYIGVSAVDDGDNVLSSSDPQHENSTFRFNISAARAEYVSSGTQTYTSLDSMSDFHSTGDIIGIALNMDNNQISIYGNGTLQSGLANSSLADAANKMVVPFHGTINDECQYNFGGYSAWTPSSAASDANGYGTFEYAPPSGYYALCTKNLAEFGG